MKNVCAILIALSSLAFADSIAINGKLHEHVLVRESSRLYYVQFPATGRIEVVDKAAVDVSRVHIEPDAAKRAALEAQCRAARGEVDAPPPPLLNRSRSVAASSEPERRAASPAPVLKANGRGRYAPRSEEYTASIKMDNVPLGEALEATLRPMGLDYTVDGETIFISTPGRIRNEEMGSLEARAYRMNNDAAALPKIVMRPQIAAGGSGAFSGGFSGGGLGGASSGGGFQGSAGGLGSSGTGFGRGAGAGGLGQNGAGNADVTAIGNISDMFSNIDDRLVGEAPATINITATNSR